MAENTVLGTRGDAVVKASQKPTNFAPVAGSATGTSGWRTSAANNRSTTNKVGAKQGKRLIYSGVPRMARAGQITDGYKAGWMGLSRDGGYGVTTMSRGTGKRAQKAESKAMVEEITRLRSAVAPVVEPTPELPVAWVAPLNVTDVRKDYEAAISNARQRESVGDASGASAWMHRARQLRRIIRNKGK